MVECFFPLPLSPSLLSTNASSYFLLIQSYV